MEDTIRCINLNYHVDLLTYYYPFKSDEGIKVCILGHVLKVFK